MLVFFAKVLSLALPNAKVLSFALGNAKVSNASSFASQWNIGLRGTKSGQPKMEYKHNF